MVREASGNGVEEGVRTLHVSSQVEVMVMTRRARGGACDGRGVGGMTRSVFAHVAFHDRGGWRAVTGQDGVDGAALGSPRSTMGESP